MSDAAGLAGESHDDSIPRIAPQKRGEGERTGELKLLPYLPKEDEPLRGRREPRAFSAESSTLSVTICNCRS